MDENELTVMKENFIRSCVGKFDIFLCSTPLSSLSQSSPFPTISWAGTNYMEFLRFAERAGVHMIYYTDNVISSDGEETRMGFIEIGFIVHGVLHLFRTTASWYVDEPIDESGETSSQEENEEGSHSLSIDRPMV